VQPKRAAIGDMQSTCRRSDFRILQKDIANMKRYLIVVLALAIVGIVASAWSQQPKAPTQPQPKSPPGAQPAAPAKGDAKADPKAAAKDDAKAKSDQPAAEIKGLTTNKQKFSYFLGLQIGSQFRGKLVKDEIDMDALVRGLSKMLDAKPPELGDEAIEKAVTEYPAELEKKWSAIGEKNKKDGDAFLAANKTKDGVKTLPDGLQYKVLKSGTGASPKKDEMAVVNYKGTLIDGTQFDSSYDRGEPAKFPVGEVIKGWSEALQMMKVGDKWQLFIPGDLGYREAGSKPDIGPNAVLVFDVELLDVAKAPPSHELLQMPGIKGN
jgi:FKBP-type peptidyl-prolyl cis-trans isomerase FklB